MPIMRYKVVWDEDNSIERIIEVDTKNTFADWHKVLLESIDFDNKHEGIFYTTNLKWKRERGISTSVKKNLSKAKFLSAKKTPVSALVKSPDQKFLYEYHSNKKVWLFRIEMMGIDAEGQAKSRYPRVARSEGLPPSQYNPNVLKSSPGIKEVEEKLDLNESDLNEDLSLNE